jgi:NADPH:quinone reductase-like Zn-dependent oxidoreductase
VAVETSALAVLPDGVAASTAAALPLAGLTALRLLRRAGALTGRSLLVTGASGGVGHYLTELAVAAGAQVTAVSATVDRGVRLRELGARTVTDLDDLTGPFDVAMESVGGAGFAAVRRLVRPDGLILWFGQASRTPITLDFFDWIGDTVGARIEQFDYTRGDRSDGADLATLVRLVADGRLHPEIGALRPWLETADVVADIRGRRLRGNAVLTITEPEGALR